MRFTNRIRTNRQGALGNPAFAAQATPSLVGGVRLAGNVQCMSAPVKPWTRCLYSSSGIENSRGHQSADFVLFHIAKDASTVGHGGLQGLGVGGQKVRARRMVGSYQAERPISTTVIVGARFGYRLPCAWLTKREQHSWHRSCIRVWKKRVSLHCD
jgi:hypothetical protein